MRLSSVHVLDVFKDKIACVGFQFPMRLDEEHGAGVMTHKGRVIATGQADCSFTQWIARQCLEREIEGPNQAVNRSGEVIRLSKLNQPSPLGYGGRFADKDYLDPRGTEILASLYNPRLACLDSNDCDQLRSVSC